jgi:sugar O-acyltransferase (sialic acid O-acetyltransferase NeuD family)
MERLAIIGSGDLGQLIAYHAETDKKYIIAGFFDDYRSSGTMVDKYNVLGKTDDIVTLFQQGIFDRLLVAIGYKHFEARKRFFDQFYGQIPFASLVHSSCYVDPSCNIGEGSVLLPGSVLDRNVKIGRNVLINVASTVAHDSTVGDHSFLSPRVAIAGFTQVGYCCNIGINTTIIDNITITDNVQTGGATVVIKNITEKGLYVGNPAKFIR